MLEPEERAFVISVHSGMKDRISSMTTAHELTAVERIVAWYDAVQAVLVA